MLPDRTDKDYECIHLKVYDEAALKDATPGIKWKCCKCHAEGTGDDSIEFIYTYDQLTVKCLSQD